jgi:hypothetical protein
MRKDEVKERYTSLEKEMAEISILVRGVGDAVERGDYETGKKISDAIYERVFEFHQKAIKLRDEMGTGEKPEESQQIIILDDLINGAAQTLDQLVNISLELADIQQNIQGGQ